MDSFEDDHIILVEDGGDIFYRLQTIDGKYAKMDFTLNQSRSPELRDTGI